MRTVLLELEFYFTLCKTVRVLVKFVYKYCSICNIIQLHLTFHEDGCVGT